VFTSFSLTLEKCGGVTIFLYRCIHLCIPISKIYDGKVLDTLIKIVIAQSGYVSNLEVLTIGISSMKLGNGREKASDRIDMAAGIILNKKIGDKVEKGEALAILYIERHSFDDIAKDIYSAFEIVNKPIEVLPTVRDRID